MLVTAQASKLSLAARLCLKAMARRRCFRFSGVRGKRACGLGFMGRLQGTALELPFAGLACSELEHSPPQASNKLGFRLSALHNLWESSCKVI